VTERQKKSETTKLPKSPTGINGFDGIVGGGLPTGRPTLVCGNAGCGKTLFGMEFLVKGATLYNEPGVFVAFEENEAELTANVASLGWDLAALSDQKKIFLDYVYLERSEIEEAGEFNLDGLFIRIENAVRAVDAKRIVIDTIEVLFSGFTDTALLRGEIRRLFRWIKERKLTAVITGEQGASTLTRSGLEEYVSDCVIFLDHRMVDQVATRRLQAIKYRGTSHGTNEYPFLITEKGLQVLPITDLKLDYPVSSERISTGIDRLDTMLGGLGYFRGSSILVSGTAGTGKSSLSACFTVAACKRGDRALYFSFEEAPQQLLRNMSSINLDLETPLKKGLLKFHSVRASSFGLEAHLSMMLKAIIEVDPAVVVIDPISNMNGVASSKDAKEMLTRLIDFMKMKGITSFFTELTHGVSVLENTETAISSLMDTWILLRDIEINGERNRGLYVLKSRGMAHSNQIREFLISSKGLQLIDVYTGSGGVLTGTARLVQETGEKFDLLQRRKKMDRLRRELLHKKSSMENRLQEMQNSFAAEKEDIEQAIAELEAHETFMLGDTEKLARLRGMDEKRKTDDN
jgi:circadian clock protein KaiC